VYGCKNRWEGIKTIALETKRKKNGAQIAWLQNYGALVIWVQNFMTLLWCIIQEYYMHDLETPQMNYV